MSSLPCFFKRKNHKNKICIHSLNKKPKQVARKLKKMYISYIWFYFFFLSLYREPNRNTFSKPEQCHSKQLLELRELSSTWSRVVVIQIILQKKYSNLFSSFNKNLTSLETKRKERKKRIPEFRKRRSTPACRCD